MERKRGPNKWWFCVCDCGNTGVYNSCELRTGHTTSCGCYKRELTIQRNYKHGLRHTRLYGVWCNMIYRCYNPKFRQYKDYGGRGIIMCDEWKSDYEAFYNWAMANGYDPDAPHGQCTIDRIDNDGIYCPENCRWVPMTVQNRNKRPRQRIARKDGEGNG